MAKKQDIALADPKSVHADAFGKLALHLGVDADAPAQELLELGISEINRAERSLMRAGACFIALKGQLPHGQFEIALEAAGVPLRQAQKAMQITQMLSELPQAVAQRLALAPPSKLLAIARADDQVLERLIEKGELADMGTISVRELELKIKRLEGQLATEHTKRETAQAETARVKDRALHRLQRVDMPEFCVVAREESTALTEQIDVALDGLTSLLNDNLLASHTEVAEADRYAATAAGTFFHSLKAAWARAGFLLQQIDEHFGEPATGMARFEHQLKVAEVDAFKHAREQIIGRMKAQASNREAVRENAKEGKKGRKRTVRDEG